MTRSIKALGLAFVAVLAMSAVAASAAQATPEFTAAAEPAFLHGTGGGEEESFEVGGATLHCNEAQFEGELAKPSSTLTIQPHYIGCTASGGLPATVTTTPTNKGDGSNCDYLFHVTNKIETDTYSGSVDVKCHNEGESIKIHIYATKAKHEADEALCTLEIPAQTGLHTVNYKVDTNHPTGPNDVTVSGTVEGIRTIAHGNSILCPGGKGEHEIEGTYRIEKPITVQATNGAEELIDGEISGE